MKLLELLGSIQLAASPSVESIQIDNSSSNFGYMMLSGGSATFGLDINNKMTDDIAMAWGPRLGYLNVSGSTSTSSGNQKTEYSGVLFGLNAFPYYKVTDHLDAGLRLAYEMTVSQNAKTTVGDTSTSSSTSSLSRIIIGPQLRSQFAEDWVLSGFVCYDTGTIKSDKIYGFQVGATISYIIPVNPEAEFDVENAE